MTLNPLEPAGFLLPKQALYQAEPRPGPVALRFLADRRQPDNAGWRAGSPGGPQAGEAFRHGGNRESFLGKDTLDRLPPTEIVVNDQNILPVRVHRARLRTVAGVGGVVPILSNRSAIR